MCNGTTAAFVLQREDAQEGKSYKVIQPYRTGPACLVPENQYLDAEGMITCAACIRNPMNVSLSGIPYLMRVRLGISEGLTGVFHPGSERFEDSIQLEDDRVIKLSRFAHFKVRLLVLKAIHALEPSDQASRLYLAVDNSRNALEELPKLGKRRA